MINRDGVRSSVHFVHGMCRCWWKIDIFVGSVEEDLFSIFYRLARAAAAGGHLPGRPYTAVVDAAHASSAYMPFIRTDDVGEDRETSCGWYTFLVHVVQSSVPGLFESLI